MPTRRFEVFIGHADFYLNVIAKSEWLCLNSIYGNKDVYCACVWWFHELL